MFMHESNAHSGQCDLNDKVWFVLYHTQYKWNILFTLLMLRSIRIHVLSHNAHCVFFFIFIYSYLCSSRNNVDSMFLISACVCICMRFDACPPPPSSTQWQCMRNISIHVRDPLSMTAVTKFICVRRFHRNVISDRPLYNAKVSFSPCVRNCIDWVGNGATYKYSVNFRVNILSHIGTPNPNPTKIHFSFWIFYTRK